MTHSVQQNARIVFCGGGSGGHLFPALAILEELHRRRESTLECLFLTSGRAIEQQILDELHIEQISIESATSAELRRRPIRTIRRLFQAQSRARTALTEFAPHCVVGCGGHGSFAGIVAAWRNRIPTLLLEQNVVPGRATSLLSRIADQVCVSFPETQHRLPRSLSVNVTGNPVRASVVEVGGARTGPPTLLVLGGSQGAQAVNQAMLQFISRSGDSLQGWRVIHQTGETEESLVRAGYQQAAIDADVAAFLTDIRSCYAAATLVVTRAGATTLAELACLGLPALVVPYPRSVRDHQLVNGNWYQQRGAARIVEQDQSFPNSFVHALRELLGNDDEPLRMRNQMRKLGTPDAAAIVAEILMRVIEARSESTLRNQR